MTTEQMQHIFEAFTQVDSIGNHRYSGAGLGLAITRRFCEMHGGTISVESQPGQGSTFTVILPIGITSQTEIR